MDPGFPRIIGESWNGIPDDIDSAFSLNDIGKNFDQERLILTNLLTFLWCHATPMLIASWYFNLYKLQNTLLIPSLTLLSLQ